MAQLQETPSRNSFFMLVVFIGVPVLAATFGYLIHYCATRPTKSLNSSHALLAEICAAHRVRPSERRLLFQIAELAELAEPATLTAIPEVFDAAVQTAADVQPLSRSQSERLQQLRQRLFAP